MKNAAIPNVGESQCAKPAQQNEHKSAQQGEHETLKSFVLDAEVLSVYPDIIPGHDRKIPVNPLVDLENAHLVIAVEEIWKLETDYGEEGREALKRLRDLFETKSFPDKGEGRCSIASVKAAGCTISVLSANGGFDKIREAAIKNNWGQLTLITNNDALALQARSKGFLTNRYHYQPVKPYTGRRDLVVPNELFSEFWNNQVVSRADFERLMPNEPKLVANEFIVMQAEDLKACNFAHEVYEDRYFRNIGRYDKERDALVALKYTSSFPVELRNAGQAIYAEALSNPDFAAVICTGPAGSGKTFMATVFGYEACKDGQFIGVTVVPCENRSNLGALPGDLDDKMDPSVQPMKNALRNYLINRSDYKKKLEQLGRFGASEVELTEEREYGRDDGRDYVHGAHGASKGKKKSHKNASRGLDDRGADGGSRKTSLKAKLENHAELIWENWFSNIPIEVARGRDFSYELAFYDEAQDQNFSQMDTLIKRLGKKGKIVITGDIEQIHNPNLTRTDNGLVYAGLLLKDCPLVAQVSFIPEEVIRHPLVKEVVKRQVAAE